MYSIQYLAQLFLRHFAKLLTHLLLNKDVYVTANGLLEDLCSMVKAILAYILVTL